MAQDTTNGNGLKNALIAALLTGAIAFFSGFALSNAKDSKIIDDHEARIRLMENAILRLTVIQERLTKER